MRFINFLTESLNFVDLPELNKKFKDRFKCSLTDCNAKMKFNGGEVKLAVNELNILKIDIADLQRFFSANGWEDCSVNENEFIYRQAREAETNVKSYYEDLAKNKKLLSLYNSLLPKLQFNFYHVSTVNPDSLFATGGLRCKNNSKVKFSKRIYMVSGKMALKCCLLEGLVDEDTEVSEIQTILDEKLSTCAEQMVLNLQCEWEADHGTKEVPPLYIYAISLPNNWPVFKDPEFNDDDEFSACACFTTQNIPVKFIEYADIISDSYF